MREMLYLLLLNKYLKQAVTWIAHTGDVSKQPLGQVRHLAQTVGIYFLCNLIFFGMLRTSLNLFVNGWDEIMFHHILYLVFCFL